ncbi:MAG: endonuclease domain-containing protein [Patescibacteria group bacterium]|nr:endonuclease domain-containing protein [Patescibacteria group bacterium]
MPELFNKKHLLSYQRNLRNKMTKSEVVFWSRVRNDQLGVRFRRQYGIGKYIVDFYCPQLKLAIEIDGLTHSDEKVFAKDEQRQKYLEGLRVIVRRYNSGDVIRKIEDIIFDLFHFIDELKKRTPPQPSSS